MTVNFAKAVEALKEGKMVTRHGWNGKGMFVFMQVPSEIKSEIVPKMQSLPEAVKNEFIKRFEDETKQIDAIYYVDQFAIVNESNVISGWSPSTADTLASDWKILD